jgi:hypothetical protein
MPAILLVFCGSAEQVWAAKAATTTTLGITFNGSAATSVAAHSVVMLTAIVKAGATTLTRGQVKLCDADATWCTDIHLIATAQLTSAGKATFKFIPGIGSHNYKAVCLATVTERSRRRQARQLLWGPPPLPSGISMRMAAPIWSR